MIRKGKYQFNDLKRIYCIAILSHRITDLRHYHNIGTIKNQEGELMDDQTTYITVELDKFHKIAEHCISDLDKLLFTMKEAHLIKEPSQTPQFFNEEWINNAIEDLESRRLTPEERMAYEMTIVNNALAYQLEKQRTEEAIKETTQRVEKETTQKLLIGNIKIMLKSGKFSVQEIAELYDVSTDFIENIKKEE